MRNLAIVLLSVLLVGIIIAGILAPATVPKSDYLIAQDSIKILKERQIQMRNYIVTINDSLVILNDSIKNLLVRPMMTKEQFLQLYKYERLKRYFDICEKNPSQKKYLWGWGRRVFGYH